MDDLSFEYSGVDLLVSTKEGHGGVENQMKVMSEKTTAVAENTNTMKYSH